LRCPACGINAGRSREPDSASSVEHNSRMAMAQQAVEGWTATEQAIAERAFEQAHGRAIDQLIVTLRTRANALNSPESIWQFHDFLSIERHTIEGRFAFRLDGILFVFASLVKEGLLQLDELRGLDADKLAKVAAMARF
jgi:hypothetical protein